MAVSGSNSPNEEAAGSTATSAPQVGEPAEDPGGAPPAPVAAAVAEPAEDPDGVPAEAPEVKDAVIYVPGLGGGIADRSVIGVGWRVARALDHSASDKDLKFTFELGSQRTDYEGGATTVHSVLRRSGDDEPDAVLDLYEFEYRNALTERWEKRNTFVQAFFLAMTLIVTFPRLLTGFFRFSRDTGSWKFWESKGKSASQVLQLLFASLVFVLLVGYLVLLVIAAVQSVQQLWPDSSPVAPGSEALALVQDGDTPSAESGGDGVTLIQQLVIVLTLIGAYFRRRQDRLRAAAVNYLAVIQYMSFGESHGRLVGQFTSLIEHVAEQADYRKIYVIAYSFGSAVSLDAFFPGARPPPPRYAEIDALVTIGCPFDFLRTFWKRYYTGREKRDGAPSRWLNVYSPVDVLGSNFRNDNQLEVADRSIEVRHGQVDPPDPNVPFLHGAARNRLRILELLLLQGLRAHEIYWSEDDVVDVNAFSLVVPELYPPGDPIYG